MCMCVQVCARVHERGPWGQSLVDLDGEEQQPTM